MNEVLVEPSAPIDLKNFIAGTWCDGLGESLAIDSPYSGGEIGLFRGATSKQIEECVAAAKEAQREWGRTPIKERTQILFRFREILRDEMNEIANLISLENGKLLAESRAEIAKGIEVLEFALSQQNMDGGAKLAVSRGVSCEYRRKPLGVVASITPFNFPAMVPMWTIPNALIVGNAYVWKPSEKTPLTSVRIADALDRAGLPKGVFSVLQGGADTASSLMAHKDIRAVAFVGSSAIAEKVFQFSSQQGKRVLALGGAKNHIVLLPDAEPTLSGQGICDSFTGCAGQRCMAASVLLAVGEVDSIIEVIKERASSIVLGRDMGAIISRQQVDFLARSIDQAETSGAKVLLDGRKSVKPEKYSNGYWIGPTILDRVDPGSPAGCEELFGPVLSIVRCDSISQAMQIENSNPYGNACSVFTSNGAHAESVLSRAEAGMLGVNIGVPVPREPFSFAGIGRSKFGAGEITGSSSLDFWSDLQKVTVKWEMQKDQNWMS